MPAGGLRTGGVDLASQDARTALAEISWSTAGAVLDAVLMGVGNDHIVGAAGRLDLVGIDCPLGWPRPFTDLLIAARAGAVPTDTGSSDGQKQVLAYRRTDVDVRTRTGRWPLSVSADRIAYPAMRCAGVLARLAADGHRIRRSGTESLIAEVYPAAALRLWGVDTVRFKTHPAARAELVDLLVQRTGWLDWNGYESLCRQEHDALDAVVCAIVAGAVALGRTRSAPADLIAVADEEGWIHLPEPDFLAEPFNCVPVERGTTTDS